MFRNRVFVGSQVSNWHGSTKIIRALAPNGFTQSSFAESAKEILSNYPNSPSGKYWININGIPKEIYCDMTNDGGGWMLYSSFGSSNSLEVTNYPALYGNRLTLGLLNSNGWTTGVQTGPLYYIDGAANNTGYYIDEPDSGSWFAFFDGSAPKASLYLNHFKLISPVVSQIRVRWGDPTNLNQQSSATLYVNGSPTSQINNNVQNNVVNYTPNNTSGANSIYIEETAGIAGISWIYVK